MYFAQAIHNIVNGVFGSSEWTLIGLSIASATIFTLNLLRD